jgi:hypothetical protein
MDSVTHQRAPSLPLTPGKSESEKKGQSYEYRSLPELIFPEARKRKIQREATENNNRSAYPKNLWKRNAVPIARTFPHHVSACQSRKKHHNAQCSEPDQVALRLLSFKCEFIHRQVRFHVLSE